MADLTPAQQNLLNFLDKLNSSSYSPALMQAGSQALDEAVEEKRRLQESIHEADAAIANFKAATQLDGGQS
ncbi:MAG: hypothetical protein AB1861_18115 [Cyanobacteriota bacterium]